MNGSSISLVRLHTINQSARVFTHSSLSLSLSLSSLPPSPSHCVSLFLPLPYPLTASEVTLRAIPPDFTKVWVQDMFRSLGPLPVFSAVNKWDRPRTVTIKRGKDGFGFMIRNSRPVLFSGVDQEGPAKVRQLRSVYIRMYMHMYMYTL